MLAILDYATADYRCHIDCHSPVTWIGRCDSRSGKTRDALRTGLIFAECWCDRYGGTASAGLDGEETETTDSDNLYADPLDLFSYRFAITGSQNDEGFAWIAELGRQGTYEVLLL